jgi:hypothetical protein
LNTWFLQVAVVVEAFPVVVEVLVVIDHLLSVNPQVEEQAQSHS